MKPLSRYHHFKFDEIPSSDRIATLEAVIVETLLSTDVPDSRRDSSVAWELKHQAGVAQCARILAAKRNMDLEIATAGALLHDIATIVTGVYEDHARRGEPYARGLLERAGHFTSAETEAIIRLVINHSDKHVKSNDPWIEFGKDADILDCFLYSNALEEYLLVKPLPKAYYYFQRGKSVWNEIGIPVPPTFLSLDEYSPSPWLIRAGAHPRDQIEALVSFSVSDQAPSPLAIWQESNGQLGLALTMGQIGILRESDDLSLHGSKRLLPDIDATKFILVWPAFARFQEFELRDGMSMFVQSEGASVSMSKLPVDHYRGEPW